MEEAPPTLPHVASRGRGQRDWLCRHRRAPAGQPERGPTGRAAWEASLRADSITSATGGGGEGEKGPRRGAARQQGGEGQVPSPTSVTSVPLRPPLVAVPTPRSPRVGEPQEGGPQGRSEGSPFPPTPTPLTASRGGGKGIGHRTRPLPPTPLPSQLRGRGRSPPTRALPCRRRVSFAYPRAGWRCRPFHSWKSTEGGPRRPIPAHAARDAPLDGAGLRRRRPVRARGGRGLPW